MVIRRKPKSRNGYTCLRILVACEMSGTVREAFCRAGHDAWSCDLLPTATPSNHRYSHKHFQCDVRSILNNGWDMLIAFPDCTYLTGSAEWAFGDGPYHQNVKLGTLVGADRREAREEAISFVQLLMDADIPYIAIENPVGCLSSRIRKPDQIIHPHQFGHDASKATCLWLKNLPPLNLQSSKQVKPRLIPTGRTNADGKPVIAKRWANQTDSGQNKLGPSSYRSTERGLTYPGIADGMVRSWSGLPRLSNSLMSKLLSVDYMNRFITRNKQ